MSTAADKFARHILTISGGKAAFYVRALDMLCPILTRHDPKPIVGDSMWHVFSLADIHASSRLGTRPSNRPKGVRAEEWLGGEMRDRVFG